MTLGTDEGNELQLGPSVNSHHRYRGLTSASSSFLKLNPRVGGRLVALVFDPLSAVNSQSLSLTQIFFNTNKSVMTKFDQLYFYSIFL